MKKSPNQKLIFYKPSLVRKVAAVRQLLIVLFQPLRMIWWKIYNPTHLTKSDQITNSFFKPFLVGLWIFNYLLNVKCPHMKHSLKKYFTSYDLPQDRDLEKKQNYNALIILLWDIAQKYRICELHNIRTVFRINTSCLNNISKIMKGHYCMLLECSCFYCYKIML